jgi:uncharacterized protein with von Willebrand factor type A (vWA) domain
VSGQVREAEQAMSGEAAALMNHTLALCQAARAAGISVTPAREIDVFRSIRGIDWRKIDDYRLTLRTNLASSRADEVLFDSVFGRYWGALDNNDSGDYIPAKSELLRSTLEDGRPTRGIAT